MSEKTEQLGLARLAARREEKRLLVELEASVKQDRRNGERSTDIIAAAHISLSTIYRWFHEVDAETSTPTHDTPTES